MKHKSKWSRKIQCIPHWTFHIARYEVLMVYLGMLVQDRFAEMCGESSKQECARWNLGVWGFAGVSLGVDLGWVYYGYGLKKCAMSWRSVRQSSKQEYVRWNLGVWGFAGVSLGVDLGWVCYGLLKCAVWHGKVFRQNSKDGMRLLNLTWGSEVLLVYPWTCWFGFCWCMRLLWFAEMRGATWKVFRQNSKQEYVRWNLGVWGFAGVSLGGCWFRMGLLWFAEMRGATARCDMETCAGKIPNRNTWDEMCKI